MGAGEYENIENDPRFAHLLAPGDSPSLSPDVISRQQYGMVAQEYGAEVLGSSDADTHTPVLFSDDGIAVGPLGSEKWLPYNEPPPPLQVRGAFHPPRLHQPLWIGRALFTHFVLSTPDKTFSYDEFFSVVGQENRGGPSPLDVRRNIRLWWKDLLVYNGNPLVLGNKRYGVPGYPHIQANPQVPVRVATTLGWETAYGAMRRQSTPL